MMNLAGKDDCDGQILLELEAAGIPAVLEAKRHRGWVPYRITGRLGPYSFTRALAYWCVSGPVPLAPPDMAHSAREGFVESHHIDTAEELALFAQTVKTSVDRDVRGDAAPEQKTIDVPLPPGSTPGVKIEVLSAGPLDGYAVITIPAGGVLGWDVHPSREVGFVVEGLIAVDTVIGTTILDSSPAPFAVPAGVRHSLRSLDGPVKILARFEAP